MSDIIQEIKRLVREVIIGEMISIEPLIRKLIEEHKRECHAPVGQALFDKVGKAIMEVENKHNQDETLEKHYDGEPCNLPLWNVPYQLEAAKGLRFTYWEFRDYVKGDWLLNNDKEIMRVNNDGMINNSFWILHAILLDESKSVWKPEVGKEAWWDGEMKYAKCKAQKVIIKQFNFECFIETRNGDSFWVSKNHLFKL